MAMKWMCGCMVLVWWMVYLPGQPAITFKVKNEFGETITFEPYKKTSGGAWVLDEQGTILIPPHGRSVDVRQSVGAGELMLSSSIFRKALFRFAGGKKPPFELRIEVTTTAPVEKKEVGVCPVCRAVEPYVYGSFDSVLPVAGHEKMLIYAGAAGGMPEVKRLYQGGDLVVEAFADLEGSRLGGFPLVEFTFKKR